MHAWIRVCFNSTFAWSMNPSQLSLRPKGLAFLSLPADYDRPTQQPGIPCLSLDSC